ncbi:hypothetical protein LSAT2_023700 [Lamellibrachia satsuma]|nr:hypothetical protein LSAT2_023700 [Lamellibrachia satsuma]
MPLSCRQHGEIDGRRLLQQLIWKPSPVTGDNDDVDATSDHRNSDDPGANTHSPVTDDSCLFMQILSLKNMVKNLPCPNGQGAFLMVEVIDVQKGPVVALRSVCGGCQHVCSEMLVFFSPW